MALSIFLKYIQLIMFVLFICFMMFYVIYDKYFKNMMLKYEYPIIFNNINMSEILISYIYKENI